MARKGCGPYNLGAPKAMATKSIAKQTTYELDYDEDTDNPVGFSGTDASGKHTTSYSYPSNEEITRSRTQVEEGLSDVSDFEEKHKFENDMIWVMKDGRWKPRTDFTAKSGYEFDNPYMQEELRKAGQNASKVHMGNLKSNNPRAYKNLVDAYNRELDRQQKKKQSQNSFVTARSQFPLRQEPSNSPNNKVKSAAYKMKGFGSKTYK